MKKDLDARGLDFLFVDKTEEKKDEELHLPYVNRISCISPCNYREHYRELIEHVTKLVDSTIIIKDTGDSMRTVQPETVQQKESNILDCKKNILGGIIEGLENVYQKDEIFMSLTFIFDLIIDAEPVEIELPIIMNEITADNSFGLYVDWGDGIATSNTVKHTYNHNIELLDKLRKTPIDKQRRLEELMEVKYTVKIFSIDITSFGIFSDNVYEDGHVNYQFHLYKVNSFGKLGHKLTNFTNAFKHCRYLKSVPEEISYRLEYTTQMFYGCENFNSLLNNWQVGTVKNMYGMFKECENFEQPLDNWQVGNVENMSYMFSGCYKFNYPIETWNVSNVKYMSHMFNNCIEFNQPLNNWNVSNITNMESMFNNCIIFNHPLNNWNVSNVSNMTGMFNNCIIFNQPLNTWKPTKNFIDVFTNCHSMTEENKKFDTSLIKESLPHRIFKKCANMIGYEKKYLKYKTKYLKLKKNKN